MGRHLSSFFSLYADPHLPHLFFLLLVTIQNSPMFINNVFLHIYDAMCKVIRKNTFFGLCHVVVVTRNLSHMVVQNALHVWTNWIWTCVVGSFDTKNAQAREMWLWGFQNVMFICSSTNITPHAFLLSINSLNHSLSHRLHNIKCTNSLDRFVSDAGDTSEL